MATAACLTEQGVPFVILERADCIASLWQRRTYDRLKLHLPKKFCEHHRLPIPEGFPEYPNKRQFVEYLECYAKHFDIRPRFNESVQSARFDESCGLWRVRTVSTAGDGEEQGITEVEYLGGWLVAASGENAEKVVPIIEGMAEFGGRISHVCEYKSGKDYSGQRVLVVGCGNSGMEVSLDLVEHNALPSMVVRDSVHVLPREVLGKSTFDLAVSMMKWLPLRLVDKIVLILSWIVLGNIDKYGLKRPAIGPLELKNTKGKTPVLDIGALEKIKAGAIKVVPGVKRFFPGKAKLVDGQLLDIDSVIFATGYRSNVPSWLQESDFFSGEGLPKQPFPDGWKGKSGLYAVGFTRRGILGASSDATRVAAEIGKAWKEETRQQNRLGIGSLFP
ncbi:hypothetical protein HPP92_020649 [Vanilla planifolia]|uniref:Flavin-containing monooxygenase n=2 Tax=Vanilla planifolia TaxID=51239 RepID=A0A835PZJ1_VANPL|nr:hypothetical protein HPP92_020649 [Vanilla planifolia]